MFYCWELRLFLASVLGKFKPSVSFVSFNVGFLSLFLLLSLVCSFAGGSVACRPSLCVLLHFLGGLILISLWITIVVIGYHVHGYCCHDSFLISHTQFSTFWLCFSQMSVPSSFSFASCFVFLHLSWSDWGIIAKLNTFRAIAHFFSFPPCDVRTFQRAFPQGLLTSCLSCLWLAHLVFI